MSISADIEFNSEAWDKSIKRISDVWNDKSFSSPERKQLKALLEIGVFKDIISHFESETAPDGAWQAWSNSYDRHMQMIGKGGNKILQDTGRLRNTMMPGGGGGSRATGDGLLFFNNATTKGGFPYAAAHDTGGPKLPKRKFMWLSDGAASDIADQVARWLQSVWEKE